MNFTFNNISMGSYLTSVVVFVIVVIVIASFIDLIKES